MGNSHNQKISEDQLDDILPHENNKKKSILATFNFEEIQLIYQLYESLRLRSKNQQGIDRDVFVKFCPIPGFWGHRLYKFMRNIDSPQSDNITFKNFIQTLQQLCRSTPADLDKNLFKIFDIRDNDEIGKEEINMMIVNMPDMGFILSQNVLIPDIQYKHIKDEVLNSIIKQRSIYNYMKLFQNTQIKNLIIQSNPTDQNNQHFQSQAQLYKQTGYTNIVTSNPMINNDVQSVNNHTPLNNISQSILERTLTDASNMQATQQFIHLNAKQLYIEMRNQLVDLTSEFLEKNAPSKQDPQMNFELFVKWLDCFPFIRMQIKESMMPRVWSLQTTEQNQKISEEGNIRKEKYLAAEDNCQSPIKERLIQDKNTDNKQNQMLLLSNIKQQQEIQLDQNQIEKLKQDDQQIVQPNEIVKSNQDQNVNQNQIENQNPVEQTPKEQKQIYFEKKAEEPIRSKSTVSCSPAFFFNFKDKNKKNDQNLEKKVTERIIPPSSIILKEGELLKVGRSTNIMLPRYYVLRDYTLFIYRDRNDKIPSNLIILRGTYINLLKSSKSESYYGFSIKSEYKSFKTIVLFHSNQEAILDWNKETQEIVAVKQINKSTLTDREKEFLREEIQIVRLISHPNIVQMKESYETDKYLYIVMEQVNGGELFEHIRTYDLDEKEVALIMNQLIEAISYLQMCGIVHRDLKPENILVEKDPRSDIVTVLKVADFGLSKITIPDEIMMESCGTPAYVAPEVLLKKGYKKEIDMWSAGIIFYTLVCRQLPFQSQDRKTTFYNI